MAARAALVVRVSSMERFAEVEAVAGFVLTVVRRAVQEAQGEVATEEVQEPAG